MHGIDNSLAHDAARVPVQEEKQGQSLLRTKGISKAFGDTRVLRDVHVDLATGDTLVILGDSGCGKTTFLRILAGLVLPCAGEMWLEGKSLERIAPKNRGIVYLDQEPMLFDHLNVFENIAFAMRLRKYPDAEVRQEVESILAATELTEHANKRCWRSSGGQKQRVAFARAILARPRVLLLDEPFCSLDSRTRASMQRLFRDLHARYRMTSVFVTHDVKEALQVGSRFALMSRGKLKNYSDRASFMHDPATGIPDEIGFWAEVGDKENPC